MVVGIPGVVTPFFQPYDDAIEAQEALAEHEPEPAESEPLPEPQAGDSANETVAAHSLP